jgi:hypothetical protein
MKAYGQRHYSPDYDRGCEIKQHPTTGEDIHRYTDETPSLWRDRFGNILPQQPSN